MLTAVVNDSPSKPETPFATVRVSSRLPVNETCVTPESN
jgi:hypothetical protein